MVLCFHVVPQCWLYEKSVKLESKLGKTVASAPENVSKNKALYILLNQHSIDGNWWIFFLENNIFTIGEIVGKYQPPHLPHYSEWNPTLRSCYIVIILANKFMVSSILVAGFLYSTQLYVQFQVVKDICLLSENWPLNCMYCQKFEISTCPYTSWNFFMSD